MKFGAFKTKADANSACEFNNKIDKKNAYFVGLISFVECFTGIKINGYCLIKY